MITANTIANYESQKSMSMAYESYLRVGLAGRHVNDGIGAYVASQLARAMLKQRVQVDVMRKLLLGLTSNENNPDLSNRRMLDLLAKLQDFDAHVDIHYPWIYPAIAEQELGCTMATRSEQEGYERVTLAGAHNANHEAGSAAPRGYEKPNLASSDLKSVSAHCANGLCL